MLALIRLLDDPDPTVFNVVSKQLLSYGKAMIPYLEQEWSDIQDTFVQERIENLIQQTHFLEIKEQLLLWAANDSEDLLLGAIIVSKFRNTTLDIDAIRKEFETLKESLWLDLNDYLTPLEKINIVNSILFNFFKLNGHEMSDTSPELYCISHTLKYRQGNALTNGILYISLCQMLDIPIFAINIPHQFILGYIETTHSFIDIEGRNPIERVQFFIDPTNGNIFTKLEVQDYLKRIDAPYKDEYFSKKTHLQIILYLLEKLRITYQHNKSYDLADDLQLLIEELQLFIPKEEEQ